MDQLTCIYCAEKKKANEFSLEHIWPDALGGNFLDDIWKARNVCRRCNNIAGMFVDAKFIRSWFVGADRWTGTEEYLNPDKPLEAVLPLAYLGKLRDGPIPEGHVVDVYAGPAGAHVWHVRPSEDEDWFGFRGGNPKRTNKQKYAGRVYITLTSAEPFWVVSAIVSAKNMFKKSARYLTNATLNGMEDLDLVISYEETSHEFREDSPLLKWKADTENKDEALPLRIEADINFDMRFLAKVSLGIGVQLLGEAFEGSEDAEILRKVWREADQEKLRDLKLRGSGYHHNAFGKLSDHLSWAGGWVILLQKIGDCLTLIVFSPSGKNMIFPITDNAECTNRLGDDFNHGKVWITVPAARQAVGPISFPDYIAHKQGHIQNVQLRHLESFKSSTDDLPNF